MLKHTTKTREKSTKQTQCSHLLAMRPAIDPETSLTKPFMDSSNRWWGTGKEVYQKQQPKPEFVQL